MTRRTARIAALLAALAIGASAWWWARTPLQNASTESAPDDVASPTANALPSPAPNTVTPPDIDVEVTVGEYRADMAGLPPVEAPLSTQVPGLRAAAERGNATAACRLAEIGLQCASATYIAFDRDRGEAFRRQQEDRVAGIYRETSLDTVPERYRDYAGQRRDIEAMRTLDPSDARRRWLADCQAAPPVTPSDAVTYLRQAALAGEPQSMARYAHGDWLKDLFRASQLSSHLGGTAEGTGMAWSRSPAFDHWRREALAVRRAGLERGDPDMLRRELQHPLNNTIRHVVPRNPVEQAAAIRAYAALVGGHTPESTAALGLSPADAAEADRLADDWAQRGRQRGRSVEQALDILVDAREVPTCE